MKVLVLLVLALVLASAACTPASRKTPGAPTRGSNGQSAGQAAGQPAAQNVSAPAGNVTKGKTLFGSSCGSCHEPAARGLPGLGKDLTTSDFVKSQNDKQLMDFVKKGRPAGDPANTTNVDMPPKGGNPAITDANLNDIISLIRSISK